MIGRDEPNLTYATQTWIFARMLLGYLTWEKSYFKNSSSLGPIPTTKTNPGSLKSFLKSAT